MTIEATDKAERRKRLGIDFSQVAGEDAPVTPSTASGQEGPVGEWPDDGAASKDDDEHGPIPAIPVPPAD